jgi:DNA-binding IclR family transcriptional regulator
VLNALKAGDESAIDEIIRASGLPSSAVNVALFSLELKRLLKQLPGKMFVSIR